MLWELQRFKSLTKLNHKGDQLSWGVQFSTWYHWKLKLHRDMNGEHCLQDCSRVEHFKPLHTSFLFRRFMKMTSQDWWETLMNRLGVVSWNSYLFIGAFHCCCYGHCNLLCQHFRVRFPSGNRTPGSVIDFCVYPRECIACGSITWSVILVTCSRE